MVVLHAGKEHHRRPGKNGVLRTLKLREQWGKCWRGLCHVLPSNLLVNKLHNDGLDWTHTIILKSIQLSNKVHGAHALALGSQSLVSLTTGGNQKIVLFWVLFLGPRGQKSPKRTPGSAVHLLCILVGKVHLSVKKTCFTKKGKVSIPITHNTKKILKKNIFFIKRFCNRVLNK